MITPNASNWVYRGESPDPTLSRVLSSYLHLDPTSAVAQLKEYTNAVRGMAEEKHEREHPASHRRGVAIALWHIAKCAEVRDRALRLLGIQPEAAT